MTQLEFFIFIIAAVILVNLAMWLDDRAKKKRGKQR